MYGIVSIINNSTSWFCLDEHKNLSVELLKQQSFDT